MRNVFRNLFAESRNPIPSAATSEQAAAAPAVAEFGPHVRMGPDFFGVGERSFARRKLPESRAGSAFNPSGMAWRASAEDLASSVPGRSEVFLHLTLGMATVLERMAEIAANERVGTFILLTGPTGCGKTTMAKTYCHLANEPCTELNFSGDTTLTDFYRRTEVVAEGGRQSTMAALGPAAEAMLLGKKLIINEINMLPPDLLSVLTQAMDTGRLLISGAEFGNAEIELHDDFGIIATANPDYVGTMEMGRSLQRRFGLGLGNVPMTFLPPEEEAESLKFEFDRQELFKKLGITANPAVCATLVGLAGALRGHAELGSQMKDRVSTRTLVHWLSLARTTGLPLAEVGGRAVLTIAPPEIQAQVFRSAHMSLASTRAATVYEEVFRRALLPPEAPDSGEAVAVPAPSAPPARTSSLGTEEFPGHEGLKLSDGRAVSIGWRKDRPPVLMVKDRDGRSVDDPAALTDVRSKLRREHGLNFPVPLGQIPSIAAALPCLTRSSWTAIRLVQGALLAGRPVFLKGPTGSGKSALARTIARLWGLEAVEFSFTGETTKSDLTAVRRLVGGATLWSLQAFMEAVREGLFVIINEYNMAYPDVHSIINGLFDKSGLVTLPDGTEIRAHPDFRLVATGFPEGPGVKPLNEGVENRFGAVVAVDYPPPQEELAILEFVADDRAERTVLAGIVELASISRAILSGAIGAEFAGGLSNIPPDLAAAVAERAALTTAEMISLVRGSRTNAELLGWYRRGVIEAATQEVRRVLEPVLINYSLG